MLLVLIGISLILMPLWAATSQHQGVAAIIFLCLASLCTIFYLICITDIPTRSMYVLLTFLFSCIGIQFAAITYTIFGHMLATIYASYPSSFNVDKVARACAVVVLESPFLVLVVKSMHNDN